MSATLEAAETIRTPVRMPADWRDRARQMVMPASSQRSKESVADLIRQILRPVLTGEFELKRLGDGTVTGFRRSKLKRLKRLSPTPRPGRPADE